MVTKNKKAEQIAAKKRHMDSLKSSRRREPKLQREKPTEPVKETFLIVCEGENTEPSYFNQFRLSTATIKPIGEGYNTVSLVKRAIELSKEQEYDQVWCVFDKDDFNDFNDAIKLAEKNCFRVAYSNQAFEYWIILHLEDHQGGGIHRRDYNDKINGLLKPFGLQYDGEKCKEITDEIFEVLDGFDDETKKERKKLAISRAKRNYEQFNHKNPAKEESSTTVFKLVEELFKYL